MEQDEHVPGFQTRCLNEIRAELLNYRDTMVRDITEPVAMMIEEVTELLGNIDAATRLHHPPLHQSEEEAE